MRILHIITTIERGGAENQLLILAREQITQGHQVTVMPLKGRLELQSDLMASAINVDTSLVGYSFFNQLRLIRKKKKNYEIVHLHLPRAELLGTLSRKNCRIVVSKHNTEPFFPGATKFTSVLLARFIAFRADAIIAISNSVAEYLCQNKEVPNLNKVEVVLYGFDKTEISDEVSAKFSNIRESSDHLLITVSRLTQQKDLGTLIQAVAKLKLKWPDVQLVIFGNGPLQNQLEDQARDLGVFHEVNFMGKTANPRGAMAQSDVFVLSSLYEGFGLVLIEAMTSKIPIVAANNSAIPEVLGSDHPMLFSTRDVDDIVNKIDLLFSNENLSTDIVDYQENRLNNFSSDRMANRIFEVYLGAK